MTLSGNSEIQQVIGEALASRPYSHACVIAGVLVFLGTVAAATWFNIDHAVQERRVNSHFEHQEYLDPNAGQPIRFVLIGQDSRDAGKDVQAGQGIDGAHRAARRGRQVSAHSICGAENRVEHYAVLGGDRALRGGAARHIHKRIARNRDEVDELRGVTDVDTERRTCGFP